MDGPSTPPSRSEGIGSPPDVRQQHRRAVRAGQAAAAADRQARGARRNLLAQFDEIASETPVPEVAPSSGPNSHAFAAGGAAGNETLQGDGNIPLMPPPRPQRRVSAHREPSTPPPSNHTLGDEFSPFQGSVASLGSPLLESDHSVTAAGASSNRDDLLLSDGSGGIPGCTSASILLSASALPLVPNRGPSANSPPAATATGNLSPPAAHATTPTRASSPPQRSPEQSESMRSATAQALWRSRQRAVAGAGARGTSRLARLRQMQQAAAASPPSSRSATSAPAVPASPVRGEDAASVRSACSARSLVSLQSLMASVASGVPPPGLSVQRSTHHHDAAAPSAAPPSAAQFSSSATPRATSGSSAQGAPSPVKKRGAGASRLSSEDAQSIRDTAAAMSASISPSKLPEASPIRSSAASRAAAAAARARALLTTPAPAPEGGNSTASATDTNTVQGVGSQLPLRVKHLCTVASAVDSVAKTMSNRGPGLLTFSKLQPSVQGITRRSLPLEHLRAVVGLAPDMYSLSRKAMDSHGRPLAGAAARKERNWRTVLVLLQASAAEFPKRRARFLAACRQFVAQQHSAYLARLGYTQPAVSASGQPVQQPSSLPKLAFPVLRNLSWHPDFKLEEVDPPLAPLPPPSAATPVMARELLRGTAGTSDAPNERAAARASMTPTVARALTNAAATQGRPPAAQRTPPRAGGVKRSAALALVAAAQPAPPTHVTLSDSSASSAASAVHSSSTPTASSSGEGADGQPKSQRKSSVQFSPMRTPQRDSALSKPTSRLYDAPTGGSVSTAPPLRAAAIGTSPSGSTVGHEQLTPAAVGGATHRSGFETFQYALQQRASQRKLHFPSSASSGSGDGSEGAITVMSVRDRARAALKNPAPSAENTNVGSSSLTTAAGAAAVGVGSVSGASASVASDLPPELAFLRQHGGAGVLRRTEQRTAATEAAAAPSAIQVARAQYLSKALPILFDAVQTQFVLTGKQVMELMLLVTRLSKAYRDRGSPTTPKTLREDLESLARFAHEWCSIKTGAASGKQFFKVHQLPQQTITKVRSSLSRIDPGHAGFQ